MGAPTEGKWTSHRMKMGTPTEGKWTPHRRKLGSQQKENELPYRWKMDSPHEWKMGSCWPCACCLLCSGTGTGILLSICVEDYVSMREYIQYNKMCFQTIE